MATLDDIKAKINAQKSFNFNNTVVRLNGVSYRFEEDYLIVSGKTYLNLLTGCMIQF